MVGLVVVVLAGALLQQCLSLLAKGVHPTIISDALFRASDKAVEVSNKYFGIKLYISIVYHSPFIFLIILYIIIFE